MCGQVIKKNERERRNFSNKLNQTISSNLSFLFAPKDVKQKNSFMRNTLDGQLIIHSLTIFSDIFFAHDSCAHQNNVTKISKRIKHEILVEVCKHLLF
jgi:Na+-transporting NADH:ubiquinone oxidoreductase subunit NqrB